MSANWVNRIPFIRRRPSQSLSSRQISILSQMAGGRQLKSHRYIDGRKVAHIHSASGEPVSVVSAEDIRQLEQVGLITSNMKFPAAAYSLTPRGQHMAALLK